MHVFVAGGTGVLGRRVVRRLIEQRHRVTCLSRSAVNRAQLAEMHAEVREGDLFSERDVQEMTAGCDAILHLATAIPTHFPSRLADWKMNDRIRTEGTENLIRAAIVNGARVMIAQSISYVYGDQHGAWVDEKTPRAAQLGGILQSALQMEALLEVARLHAQLPVITLRFGTFYGPDAWHTQSTFELIERGKLPIIGDGDAWWNMIHLDDAARAVVAAIEQHERNLGEVFNIADGAPVHMHEFANGLAEILDAKKPWHLPAWLARLRLGNAMLEPLLLSMRCSNEKARKQLAWQPRYPDFRYGHRAALKAWRGELAGV